MTSRALLFVFALLQAQVMVPLALSPTSICPERCEDDDGPEGRCPPVCPSCPVSTHTVSPVSVVVVATPSLHRQTPAATPARVPSEPEPADIFHVPKRLLA